MEKEGINEGINIKLSRTFYVVPFYYIEKPPICDDKVYSKIKNHMDDSRIWESIEWRIGSEEALLNEESDIYTYILDSFFSGGSNRCDKNNIGESWVINHALLNQVNVSISQGGSDSIKTLTVSNAGLCVFRSGVAFFWYEIQGPQNMTCEEFARYQNSVKELSRGTARINNSSNESSSFSGLFNSDEGTEVEFGVLVDRILKEILKGSEIRYFATRIIPQKTCNSSDNRDYHVPDKALLFTFLATEKDDKKHSDNDKTIYEWAYRTAGGYPKYAPKTYPCKNKVSENIYEPFDGQMWYMDKECCSYLTTFSNYTDKLKKRFVTNYFPLYLFLLHQTYSIQRYSELMGTMISASSEFADKKDVIEEEIDTIDSFRKEVSTFLVKGIYGSVAHLQNVNDYYVFLFNKLRIAEDTDYLQAGLTALSKLKHLESDKIKNKKDETIQKLITLISFVSVISVITDVIGLKTSGYDKVFVLFFIILILILVITIIWWRKGIVEKVRLLWSKLSTWLRSLMKKSQK